DTLLHELRDVIGNSQVPLIQYCIDAVFSQIGRELCNPLLMGLTLPRVTDECSRRYVRHFVGALNRASNPVSLTAETDLKTLSSDRRGLETRRVSDWAAADQSRAHFFKSAAMAANCCRAASKSSTISAAIISGSGRFALSSSDSSLSQKISRLSLSRLSSSS